MPRDWLPREDKLIAFLRAQRNIIPSHLWLMSVDGATQVSGPDWKKGSSQGLVASTKGGQGMRPRAILPDERREGMDLVKKSGMGLAKRPPMSAYAVRSPVMSKEAGHRPIESVTDPSRG